MWNVNQYNLELRCMHCDSYIITCVPLKWHWWIRHILIHGKYDVRTVCKYVGMFCICIKYSIVHIFRQDDGDWLNSIFALLYTHWYSLTYFSGYLHHFLSNCCIFLFVLIVVNLALMPNYFQAPAMVYNCCWMWSSMNMFLEQILTQEWRYRRTSNISRTKSQHVNAFCNCLCPFHWSQVLSREWRCSWSSADRRCSNYFWVINNFIAY